jgi:fatty-acyl-CoA synthase
VRAPFSRTLFDLLCEQTERKPSALAVVSRGAEFTYAEVLTRARQLAGALRDHGVRRNDRVGAVLGNRIEWLDLVFGCSAVGATFVPLSTWSTRAELEFLVADAGVCMLFVYAKSGDRDFGHDLAALAPELAQGRPSALFPTLREIILVDAGAAAPFAGYEDFAAASEHLTDLPPGDAASPADDALILYTSGSSAYPKAVRLRHFGMIENGFNIGERMGLSGDDRVMLSAPLFWSYGSANAMCATLGHGAALVLQERFEPAGAISLIESFACTAIYTLPGMTKAIATHSSFAPARVATLRTGLTIGAPSEFLYAVKTLGADRLCNIYGATETYGNCCVTSSAWSLEKRAQSQGEPLPGNELRFVDSETGAPAAPGEPGLVEVRGYISPGYDGASADQNAKSFTPDGFYRTGDIGRLDESGAFVFVARNTEMIKRAGINVSPAEVENILLAHPLVAQAAVVGAADADRGEAIVAFVVASSPSLKAEDLISHCRSIASKYKVPDRIILQDALPLTATGKLQRRALKETAQSLLQSG